MSWLYSQALVEEYLGGNFSDGEQSAPLNGNPIQQAYLSPDKMTDFSRVSRFGMTYRPLTEDRGEELLTSYLAAFHVKTFPQLAKEPELTESEAECGSTWQGSFAKYDPDTSSWKTHQCSLLGDLDEFSETWPRWGLMRDGECWEQPMSAHRISVTESGLEPDNEKFFHTPNCTGMDGGSNSRKALKKRMETWPTPRTKGMCGGTGSWELLKKNTTIEEARQMGAGNGGKLNPDWTEWLMGFPIGWTDLKPLETDKYHLWLQQHGKI